MFSSHPREQVTGKHSTGCLLQDRAQTVCARNLLHRGTKPPILSEALWTFNMLFIAKTAL